MKALRQRLWNKWRRFMLDHYARRDFTLSTDVPYVTFTFDDFPRSAFCAGGRILAGHGVRGTYFISLQRLGSPSVSGLSHRGRTSRRCCGMDTSWGVTRSSTSTDAVLLWLHSSGPSRPIALLSRRSCRVPTFRSLPIRSMAPC